MRAIAKLTPSEVDRLSRFCEVCDSIASCRFLRDFAKQSHHVCIGRLPDGRIVDEYPRYDDDDLRAFLTHYRKLRLEGEPTHLLGIIKLVKWKGDPGDRDFLDELRRDVVEEGKGWWGAAVADQAGRRFLTQTDVEDLILNGDVFHSEPAKRHELQKALGTVSLAKAIACWNYLRFASVVVGCAQMTADLVRKRDYTSLSGIEIQSAQPDSLSPHSDI